MLNLLQRNIIRLDLVLDYMRRLAFRGACAYRILKSPVQSEVVRVPRSN